MNETEIPESEWRSEFKVRDVVAALLLLDQDADVWEYSDPGGECPLHRLPRVKQVAYRLHKRVRPPERPDGYWHTLYGEPDERDTNVQTVVMI